jgi:hypothetical protein
MRTVAMMWNSYRFQSKAVQMLMESLRLQSATPASSAKRGK